MSKRTTFTTISPLPPSITRQVVIDFLHNHLEMIDLNPLVIERHPIDPPPHATPDEVRCIWYSLTDKISYLPGGLADGDVTYTCAFHDLPHGIQTHCYAPAGLSMSLFVIFLIIITMCILTRPQIYNPSGLSMAPYQASLWNPSSSGLTLLLAVYTSARMLT